MDTESWKTVITTVSSIIAVASAYLAYRVRIQTRTDIFENHRDALILIMADNDSRCSHLEIQVALAREELEHVLQVSANDSVREQANRFLANIAEIEKITHSLDAREYNLENLDALNYSEEALSVLRKMERGERVNAKQLAVENYDLILKHIERFSSNQKTC